MKQLKILHIITRLIVGGAQENTLFTVEGLMKKGYKSVLATGPQSGSEGSLLERAYKNNVDIKIIPHLVREINPVYDLIAYREITDLIKNGGFDIVHTHSSKAGVLGRISAKRCGIPIIAHTIHGLAFHRFENPLLNLLYLSLERYTARFTSKIITVGDVMKDKAISAKIAKHDKIVTIYSGIEMDEFSKINEDSKSIRKKIGIPEDAFVIGKIARLVRLKGHNYILMCAKEIIKNFPNTYFLFVGGGYLKSSLEKKTQKQGIEKRFIWTGLVPPSEIPQLIGAMDILIHTSLREGLPRTIPQALACGKPVIAFDIDGACEVVKDGFTGYLVQAKDYNGLRIKIIELLKNPDLRRRIGQQGREFVRERFDIKTMVDSIEQEYIGLINDLKRGKILMKYSGF